MRSYLIIILLLPTTLLFCQDTLYLDKEFNKVNYSDSAYYYSVVQHDHVNANSAIVNTYFKSGQIYFNKYYSNYKEGKLDGNNKEYYENGRLHKTIDYKDGVVNGQLLTFWNNGKPKRIDNYKDGKLTRGKCFNSDGKEIAYCDYFVMPKFQGGQDSLTNYLTKEIQYPKEAKKYGIEGQVIVAFVVEANGTISKIRVIQSIDKELDAEAIRVIKNMPNWEPGLQDGIAGRVEFHLPLNFKLTHNNR